MNLEIMLKITQLDRPKIALFFTSKVIHKELLAEKNAHARGAESNALTHFHICTH